MRVLRRHRRGHLADRAGRSRRRTLHDTASIATILFSRYVLPFEIAGLSLTIALIGAVVLAREDDVLDDAAAKLAAEPVAEAALAEDEGDAA